VNRLVGQKVAIVNIAASNHTQPDSRNRKSPNAQVVLIDTPGLHRPDSALGRQMMGEVNAALDGVDVLALILDVSEDIGKEIATRSSGRPVLKERAFCF